MSTICATYTPSEVDTKRFWDQEVARTRNSLGVPDGYPDFLTSPLAWRGEEIQAEQPEWKLDLTEEEIGHIDVALNIFEAEHEDLSAISSTTFKLPQLFSQRLRELSDQLYNGRGFQIIHGIDPTRYTPKQKIIVYSGITAHICPQRGFIDVAAKRAVAHVVNVQAGENGAKSTAPAFSNGPLSFHTDNCEIMAFFYLDTALSGGRTVLSSIWQTYNELAANRPEVLHTLAQPWVLDTFKPVDLQPPRHAQPLQMTGCDKVPVLMRFSRYPVTGFQRQRNPNLPSPTQDQLEAADAIQFIAMKNSITLPVVKGDMLFVNDMALFHAREAFDDGGLPLKRHLIKMYFRDPSQGWDIPPSLEKEWKTTYMPNQSDGSRKEIWDIFYEPGLEELSMLNG
ncbi:hypothetical protein KJ359_003881 [Pestalotiopsis sp. 9143b]|nr:hypothetical protein KJ359_003881 [Pestalotiopsis sp. 9143b]